ncbi:hypothetical protein Poli38472_000339 [Pythium oligandrum]|uniref:Uncharacterized protein n=1 Tax=Pythium oligandrum TaxID=41045 RepID=A0A8K1CDI6_PYTOL|nr:hypothetical protein Poli38472_000339 [Pythium oligandrum]|eukprot:TMW60297.1 hypothetical protein Poli38472_000339 [Pythium oligandrum]
METRSSWSMRELRAIAADRGLKYYRHLSKPELHALLHRKAGGALSAGDGEQQHGEGKESSVREGEVTTTKETETTSTKEKKMKATRCSERISALKRKVEDDEEESERERKKAKKVINTLDPIMLTELGPHTFEFVRSNGSIVVYNVDSLVQYILATGDFSEPETRIPFSDDDLRRIDAEAKRAKLDERSVLEAKHNKHLFDEQKVKRDGLLGLERCAGEFITQMLEVVENDDPEEGEMQLIMTLFPSFSSIFEQIRSADKEYAKHSMNHFKAYLRGPKNRPTVDNSGLLSVILGFLDDVSNGRQAASAFGF